MDRAEYVFMKIAGFSPKMVDRVLDSRYRRVAKLTNMKDAQILMDSKKLVNKRKQY
jgi:hypothetical protein